MVDAMASEPGEIWRVALNEDGRGDPVAVPFSVDDHSARASQRDRHPHVAGARRAQRIPGASRQPAGTRGAGRGPLRLPNRPSTAVSWSTAPATPSTFWSGCSPPAPHPRGRATCLRIPRAGPTNRDGLDTTPTAPDPRVARGGPVMPTVSAWALVPGLGVRRAPSATRPEPPARAPREMEGRHHG